jgi:hypothetical protein
MVSGTRHNLNDGEARQLKKLMLEFQDLFAWTSNKYRRDNIA